MSTTTYLGSGDPRLHRTDYYPSWLDDLAEDVTMEASVLNGIVHGPESVRAILAHARTLYDYQEFVHVGEYGENGFAEDYVSKVRGGEPIGSVVVIRRNAAGQTQRIVINHRPLRAVVTWSRLMGEHFAGTPYAGYFLAPGTAEDLLPPAQGEGGGDRGSGAV